MLYKFLENNNKNSLWRDLDRINEAISRSFWETNPYSHAVYPPINVYTRDDEALVQAMVPGVSLEDLDLSVKDNVLTLKGRKREEELSEGTEVHLREIYAGEFERTLEFPFRIDADKVAAEYKDGILSVILPKREEDKPKKIKVQNA